jgi:hypothetical protein
MAAKQLSDYGPDGTLLGQAAADLIGFHGTAGTVQVALSATAALTTTVLATGSAIYGFNSAQSIAIIPLINALRAALVTKGLAST